ncbi:NifB/NifX family molybdenum-iron cluster-binding protein [Maridesulfovibrio sp.]|jgi:predicted Fe-Mo cluster-binding NifX family protein|uniref:NifB/NifX family molybdenum-iron cluster-binding protein n=1 Tax=Maridesulfovibrio sp. TaxID=2795000 RepID=UPI0029CA33A5|nr:NifB/NifX family molybdenum-iron cluster-binding protein [Maridesulfovibrio sp.]
MKIALPSRNGMVDGHFGHCEAFTIFTLDDAKNIIEEETLTPPPGCGCKSNIVPQLSEKGVELLLAGNMGQGAVNLLQNSGIQVIRGCDGDLKETVAKWAAGSLTDSAIVCDDHESCGNH